MAQEVTLGGDRIGSGNKQKVELHNYGMNSFNLEQDWKSSMAPGILYPFLKLVGTNHGTFDIDLDSFVRTLPTNGPLFGSFKLQLDVYSVPIRLYQGILHNNPIGIGLKMNQVYLPKLKIQTVDGGDSPMVEGSTEYDRQINSSSLLKYLGISGLGRSSQQQSTGTIGRKMNAIPVLAYYDIFKCYYSNKQEENAYVITPGTPTKANQEITNWDIKYQKQGKRITYPTISGYGREDGYNIITKELENTNTVFWNAVWNGRNLDVTKIDVILQYEHSGAKHDLNIHKNLYEFADEYGAIDYTDTQIQIANIDWDTIEDELLEENDTVVGFKLTFNALDKYYQADIQLTPFKLANIDDMRNALLSSNTLGAEFVLGTSWTTSSGTDETGLPYSALFQQTTQGITWNAFKQNGLVVKTYQSDLFNNWLDTEFIDGENGISAISAVDTQSGSFTMDSLNLAEKIYELLNRVLVSGGTYEDWQEAVYGEGAVRKAETPMYIGGMAAEIMFEEVIATTEVKSEQQALGSLGGKGTQVGKRGGNNIHVKCDEPSYIIGIASITPRICYSQGNDWDMTEIDTLDDLHKPALDGIGFQDLMVEQLAWWNTIVVPNSLVPYHRDAVGKQTAWINYQTAVDKCFGDFAKEDGYAFMVLNRNYEMDLDTSVSTVKDITTYIDPAKYNYAFTYTDLDAQNFWVQIHSKVIARRKMGAQQIPNL